MKQEFLSLIPFFFLAIATFAHLKIYYYLKSTDIHVSYWDYKINSLKLLKNYIKITKEKNDGRIGKLFFIFIISLLLTFLSFIIFI